MLTRLASGPNVSARQPVRMLVDARRFSTEKGNDMPLTDSPKTLPCTQFQAAWKPHTPHKPPSHNA